MLESFFSLDADQSIFDGLNISKETALCEEYMGKYPVLSVSLKGIDARTYETAYQMTVRVMIETAAKFYFLLDSEKLNAHDKAEYIKSGAGSCWQKNRSQKDRYRKTDKKALR